MAGDGGARRRRQANRRRYLGQWEEEAPFYD